MKVFRFILLAVFFSASSLSFAQPGRAYWGIDITTGKTSYSQELVLLHGDKLNKSSSAVTLMLGYQWGNNIVIEANSTGAGSINLFNLADTQSLYETKALIGYAFNLSEHIRLVPMAGMSSWAYDSEDELLLHPGKEDVQQQDGKDVTYKVNMIIPMKKHIQLNFSVSHTGREYGNANSAGLGVKYTF